MSFLVDLLGMLAFRTRALRALASRQALVAASVLLGSGLLVYSLIRNLLYSTESPANPHGGGRILSAFLELNLLQSLLFLSFLYVPAVICLSNTMAGDGLGFSFSREEYRSHVAVLFPLWGALFLHASALQWLVPAFLSLGRVEIPLVLLLLLVLLAVYSVWAIKELNYISTAAALGVFVLSWFSLPVFFVLTTFVFALPFFLLLPLGYVLLQRLQGFYDSRGREGSFRQHLESLTTNPQDADALYQLGLIHFKRGNLEEAGGYFQKARGVDPSDPDYSYYLGRVFEEKGDWEAALKEYESVYRLNPEYKLGDIFREVGKAYLHAGNPQKAAEFLQFFLSRRESDPEARYWLAVTFDKLSRPAEMQSQLRTIFEQARSNPSFFRKANRRWLYRARTLLRSQRRDN